MTLFREIPSNYIVSLGLLLLFSVGPLRPLYAEVDSTARLVDALLEGSEGVRVGAATRLFHLGQAGRAVPRLIPRLRSADPNERCLAARLLGLLRSEVAIASLIELLSDDDWAVRRDAAEALGQIGSATAVGAVARRLEDSHLRVRIAAARALGDLDRCAALIAALLDEPDPEVRFHYIEVIGRCDDPAALPALEGALHDEAESLRRLAASYAIERGSTGAVDVLGEGLTQGPGVTSRREAAAALARATGAARAPARSRLAATLNDTNGEVGLAAAVALVELDDPRGRSHLLRVARESRDASLRARAIALLAENDIGGL